MKPIILTIKVPFTRPRFYVRKEWGPFVIFFPKSTKRIGYMDSVDFDHELGYAADGNRIYPSPLSLETNKKCVGECGIYEVEVRFKRVIKEEDWSEFK